MQIFDFVTPGAFLNYEDQAWVSEIYPQISSLESAYFEANDALNLFFWSLQEASIEDVEGRDKDRIAHARRAQIEMEVSGFSFGMLQDRLFENRVKVDSLWKTEKWSAGAPPKEFIWRRPHLFAKMFVFALDNFERILEALSGDAKIPHGIGDAHAEMKKAFPALRGIRNSAHHLEDRVRGLDRNKKIALKPFQSGGINAPHGALVLSALHGTMLGYTMGDGSYGEIDVSRESMLILRGILEKALKSFSWRGPMEHKPSY